MAVRLTARLVGEGYGKPSAENELPIDVNYAKLTEWLVSSGSRTIRGSSACLHVYAACKDEQDCDPTTAGPCACLHASLAVPPPLPPPLLPPPAASLPHAAARCLCVPPVQVDRKQVPADFNRKLQAIQAKAAEAVRELPPGFLGQFEGEHVVGARDGVRRGMGFEE